MSSGNEESAKAASEEPQPLAESSSVAETGSSAAAPATAAVEATSVDKVAKKPRLWRRLARRWKFLLLLFFVVLLALRGVLSWRLPALVDSVAEQYGLSAHWESLDMTLLSLDVEMWHFELKPRDGGDEPLVYLEYLRGDVSVWDLLRGRLNVTRVEGDGVELFLRRGEAGDFPDLNPLLAKLNEGAEEATPVEPQADSTIVVPDSLSLPLALQALRFQHVLFHYRDESVTPTFETQLHGNLRVSNVNHPTRPLRFEWEQWVPQLLDRLTVRAEAKLEAHRIAAHLDVDLAGLFPSALLRYLLKDDEIVQQEWNGSLAGDLVMTAEADKPLQVQLSLSDLVLSERVGSQVELDALSAAFSWSAAGIEQSPLQLKGLRVHLLQLAAPLEWSCSELTLTPGEQSVALQGVGSIEGIAREWRLDGAYTFTPESLGLELQAELQGLQQEKFNRFLEGSALRCGWTDATASGELTVDARWTEGLALDMRVEKLLLRSGDEVLARADAMQLSEFRWQDGEGAARALSQRGVELTLRRDKASRWHTLGWSYDPARAVVEATAPSYDSTDDSTGVVKPDRPASVGAANPVVSSAAHTPLTLPSFALSTLSFGESKFHFIDELCDERFDWDDVGFEVKDIAQGQEATVRGWFDGGESSGRLGAEGRARVSATGVMFTGHVDLQKFPLARLVASYGPPECVCSTELLRAGFDVAAGFELSDKTEVALNLFDMNLGSAEETWLSWRDMELTLELGGQTPLVSRCEWIEPKLVIVATDQGNEFLGCRWQPAVAPAPSAADLAADQDATAAPEVVQGGGDLWSALTLPPLHEILAEPLVVLRSARIENALLEHRVGPNAVDTRGWGLTATLSDLVVGGSEGGRWHVEVSQSHAGVATGVSVHVDGGLFLTAEKQGLDGELKVTGISGDRLQSWLPDEVEVTLEEGVAQGSFALLLSPNPSGGSRLSARSGVFRIYDQAAAAEGGGAQDSLSWQSMALDIARVDGAARVLVIDNIEFTGFSQHVVQQGRSLELAGLRLTPKAARSAAPDAVTSTQKKAAVVASGSSLRTLPQIEVRQLRVAFGEVTCDLDKGDPLRLEEFELRLSHPWSVGEEAPEDERWFEGVLTARVAPLMKRMELRWGLTPQDQPIEWKMAFAVDGIDPEPLLVWLGEEGPLSREQIDVQNLRGSRFRVKSEGLLEPAQLAPLQWDFTRPLPFEVSIRELALTNAAGEVLAGVDEIRFDGGRWDGKRSQLRLRAAEVVRPQLRLQTWSDAVEAFGVKLSLSNDAVAATDRGKSEVPETAPGDHAQVARADGAAQPAVDGMAASDVSARRAVAQTGLQAAAPIRLDLQRLQFSELDVSWIDHSLDTPTTVRFDQLDFLLQDLQLALGGPPLVDAKPLRFSFFAAAAPSELPLNPPQTRSPLPAIQLDGQFVLHPLQGNVVGRLEGFEVVIFKGVAKSVGIELHEGTLDGRFDVTLEANGELATDSAFTFTDLDLEEGEAGLLRSLLKLPTPVQVVVLAIRDQEGSISVPLDVRLGEDAGLAQFGPVVLSAISGVLLDALAAAPLRLGGALVDLTGLSDDEESALASFTLEFEPATAAVIEAQGVTDVITALRDDEQLIVQLVHSWGEHDLQLAQARLTSDPQTTLRWAQRGRLQKQELEDKRRRHLRGLEAILESGFPSDVARWRQDAQRLDLRLAGIERSLDDLLDWIDGRSQRWLKRRVREDAVILGGRRVAAIRQRLLESGVEAGRIESRPISARQPKSEPGQVELQLRRRRIE